MVVVLTRPRIASHDRDRTTWRVLPFAFSHCMQRPPRPFALTSSHIGNATIHRVSVHAKGRATRKRRRILASAADFVVGLDTQLSLRLAHGVHSLLYVPTRVPRPAHYRNHALTCTNVSVPPCMPKSTTQDIRRTRHAPRASPNCPGSRPPPRRYPRGFRQCTRRGYVLQ